MKTFTELLLIFSLLFCCNAVAQTDLAGTWQDKLAVDQNNKMTIQYILAKKADGSLKPMNQGNIAPLMTKE